MVAEVDSDSLNDLAGWALETGIWDGRPITWEEAPEFYSEVECKIARVVLSPDCLPALAWLGTVREDRSLLAREIQELTCVSGVILAKHHGKSWISKFWKEHKTAILIGAAVVAVATVATVVVVCSGGVAAGALAAGGGALTGLGGDGKEKEKKSPPPAPVRGVKEQVKHSPPPVGNPTFLENGVVINGEFLPYNAVLQSVNRDLLHPSFNAPSPPPPSPPVYFSPASPPPSCCRIGGINGMKTAPEEAERHTDYLGSFAPNQKIDWVYNRTHGSCIDLAEVFALNYLGISPNTAKDLRQNWVAFHEANKDNPNAKYLQFCHSQGAIHVRNALLRLPQEICDRIIVVAIAPAAVVSREMCFQSFNYKSKKDVVPYGELLHAGFLDSNECGISKCTELVLEGRKQLIVLDPHPDAAGIDHEFQSPTFSRIIQKHVKDYLYRTWFKNWEFGKKAPQIFWLRRVAVLPARHEEQTKNLVASRRRQNPIFELRSV